MLNVWQDDPCEDYSFEKQQELLIVESCLKVSMLLEGCVISTMETHWKKDYFDRMFSLYESW